jgi:hypothetical protein
MITRTTALLFLFALLQPANAETRFEVGANFASGDFTKSGTLIVQERWGKYGLSFGYVASQTVDGCGDHPRQSACIFPVREQLIVGAERIFTLGNFAFRVGPYVFSTTNRISSAKLNGRVAAEYRLNDFLFLKDPTVMISHFSNGGSGEVIKIENPAGVIHKGRFNMGLDGIFITGRF